MVNSSRSVDLRGNVTVMKPGSYFLFTRNYSSVKFKYLLNFILKLKVTFRSVEFFYFSVFSTAV